MTLSIAFMYLCVLALVPFMAFAVHLLVVGEREREAAAAARVAAALQVAAPPQPARPIVLVGPRPVPKLVMDTSGEQLAQGA